MAKKFKFPNVNDYSAKEPVVFCPAPRIISLYNEAHDEDGKRISDNKKKWFEAEAKSKGWLGCLFVPTVETGHGAGAILLRPTLVHITRDRIEITIPDDQKE